MDRAQHPGSWIWKQATLFVEATRVQVRKEEEHRTLGDSEKAPPRIVPYPWVQAMTPQKDPCSSL